jgi:hypothetical protein
LAAFLIVAFFAMTAFLSFEATRYEELFRQLEMKVLPVPTEGFLAMAAFVRSPVGLIVWTLGALIGAGLVQMGVFDGRLKAVAALLILAILASAGLYFIGVRLPIVKIQRALEAQSR